MPENAQFACIKIKFLLILGILQTLGESAYSGLSWLLHAVKILCKTCLYFMFECLGHSIIQVPLFVHSEKFGSLLYYGMLTAKLTLGEFSGIDDILMQILVIVK